MQLSHIMGSTSDELSKLTYGWNKMYSDSDSAHIPVSLVLGLQCFESICPYN